MLRNLLRKCYGLLRKKVGEQKSMNVSFFMDKSALDSSPNPISWWTSNSRASSDHHVDSSYDFSMLRIFQNVKRVLTGQAISNFWKVIEILQQQDPIVHYSFRRPNDSDFAFRNLFLRKSRPGIYQFVTEFRNNINQIHNPHTRYRFKDNCFQRQASLSIDYLRRMLQQLRKYIFSNFISQNAHFVC